MTFYVPQTLAADFDDFLNTDVPNQVTDFDVYHDWYSPEDVYTIRMEIYPDSTKSRYENMDNKLNVRASLTSGIQKGDIVIQADTKQIFLLDWEEYKETNNIPSMALRCNANIKFFRHIADLVDDDGFLIHDKDNKNIADTIPCNISLYDGRPEYSDHQWTPGLVPNALITVNCQCNEETLNIKIGDCFMYYDETYSIVNISRTGVKMNGNSGVLTFSCKREAGGGYTNNLPQSRSGY